MEYSCAINEHALLCIVFSVVYKYIIITQSLKFCIDEPTKVKKSPAPPTKPKPNRTIGGLKVPLLPPLLTSDGNTEDNRLSADYISMNPIQNGKHNCIMLVNNYSFIVNYFYSALQSFW